MTKRNRNKKRKREFNDDEDSRCDQIGKFKKKKLSFRNNVQQSNVVNSPTNIVLNGNTHIKMLQNKPKLLEGNINHKKGKKVSPNVITVPLQSLLQQKQSLPIYSIKRKLISEIKKDRCVIVIGETGSGKTTQIPQYIYEEGLNKNGTICITQPRRVAAISIAKRVAEEMNSSLGTSVGYSVRFEEACTKQTRIKYVTDGMLLREALLDTSLSLYTWILLDEAHERSIATDILFGVVKSAQKKRAMLNKSPLNIIVMSATMDVDHFSQYFNNAKVLYIEGRQHPVEILYAREKKDDYTLTCMSTIFQIHKEAQSEEDILLFLTGQEEIDSTVQTLRQISQDPSLSSYPKMKIFPLYAALPSSKQMDVFKPSCPGERKVIVSTNIAETSVTIPGIKYVVDCGRSKVRTYNFTSGFDILKVCKISQAQSWQRSGRAGRERPGVCYRAYTLEEFDKMRVNPIPEILRANLTSVILQLFAIGIKDVINFDFISKPSEGNIKEAETILVDIGAIEIANNNRSLTPLGKSMSRFPLEPRFSKVIINASKFGCLEEILTIAAILSGESIYVNPSNQRDTIAEVRRKFMSAEGDHITLLKIYRSFESMKKSKSWCFTNFLNHRNLLYASKVREQLLQICIKQKLTINSCKQSTEPVLRCFLSGLFTNIAELQVDGKYVSLHSRQPVLIHPTSVLFGGKPPYILFTELVKTGKTYMHINSSVDAMWLIEENPVYFKTRHMRAS